MSTAKDFYEADLGAFFDLARTFRNAGEEARDHAVDFWTKVMQHLKGDDLWRGPTATAAQKPMGDLQLAMNRAADALEAVPGLLEDLAERAGAVKTKLKGLVGDAQAAGFTVNLETGKVTPPQVADEAEASRYANAAEAYAQDIGLLWTAALEIDSDVLTKLREVLDVHLDATLVGSDYRDDMSDVRRIDQLLDEMKEEGRVDPEKLAEIRAVLDANSHDTDFPRRLYGELGGGGTMALFADVAALTNRSADEEVDADVAAIHQRLGEALARVTDPDMPASFAMDSQWMDEFQKAGRQVVEVPHVGYGPPPVVRGYQLLAPLLERGTYSTEFLETVGGDMVAMEQKQPDVFRQALMGPDMHHVELMNRGFDPIDGLMTALGNNPEAARDFFTTGDQDNPGPEAERIAHVLDRDENWQSPLRPHTENMQARYIDVLATASAGQPPGSQGFAVAAETIEHFGSTDPYTEDGEVDPEKLGLSNDESRESMADLLAGQIEHVNDGFRGGELGDGPALERVLVDVAHSSDAYVSLNEAQYAFTAEKMNEYVSDSSMSWEDKQERIARYGQLMGNVLGHLDEGQHQAIASEWQSREDYENSWVEAGGNIVGYGMGEAVSNIPGAGLVTDGIVDQVVESYKENYDQHAAANQAELTEGTQHHLKQMAEQIVWQAQEFPKDSEPPPELYDLDTGLPIPLSAMTEDQWNAYRDWKLRDDAYDAALSGQQQTLDDAYDSGRNSAARKTAG